MVCPLPLAFSKCLLSIHLTAFDPLKIAGVTEKGTVAWAHTGSLESERTSFYSWRQHILTPHLSVTTVFWDPWNIFRYFIFHQFLCSTPVRHLQQHYCVLFHRLYLYLRHLTFTSLWVQTLLYVDNSKVGNKTVEFFRGSLVTLGFCVSWLLSIHGHRRL